MAAAGPLSGGLSTAHLLVSLVPNSARKTAAVQDGPLGAPCRLYRRESPLRTALPAQRTPLHRLPAGSMLRWAQRTYRRFVPPQTPCSFDPAQLQPLRTAAAVQALLSIALEGATSSGLADFARTSRAKTTRNMQHTHTQLGNKRSTKPYARTRTQKNTRPNPVQRAEYGDGIASHIARPAAPPLSLSSAPAASAVQMPNPPHSLG